MSSLQAAKERRPSLADGLFRSVELGNNTFIKKQNFRLLWIGHSFFQKTFKHLWGSIRSSSSIRYIVLLNESDLSHGVCSCILTWLDVNAVINAWDDEEKCELSLKNASLSKVVVGNGFCMGMSEYVSSFARMKLNVNPSTTKPQTLVKPTFDQLLLSLSHTSDVGIMT